MTPQQFAYLNWRLEVNRFRLAQRLKSQHAIIRKSAKLHRYESWRMEQAARIPPERHNRKQAAWFTWICAAADLYEQYRTNAEHPAYREQTTVLRERRDAALMMKRERAA